MSLILFNRFDRRLNEILTSWPDIEDEGLVDLQQNISILDCPQSPFTSTMDLHEKYHFMQNTLHQRFIKEINLIHCIFKNALKQQQQMCETTFHQFLFEKRAFASFTDRIFTGDNEFCSKITELFTQCAKRIKETWINRKTKIEIQRKIQIQYAVYRYREASKNLAVFFENDTKFSLEHSPKTPESIIPKQIEKNLANLAYEFPPLRFFQPLK